MKQIILLISILSSLFTYNGDNEKILLSKRIEGGWTLTPASKISYFDAQHHLINERILPLNLPGTILNIDSNKLIIRNNKNEIREVGYAMDETFAHEGTLHVYPSPSADSNEIISLLNDRAITLERDRSNALRFTCRYDKSSPTAVLDKSVDFDYAIVEMVYNKNSFFSDYLLPY